MRRTPNERRADAGPITQIRDRHKHTGDSTLPGIAGYHGLDPVGRKAMPPNRFVYKRPDGRAD